MLIDTPQPNIWQNIAKFIVNVVIAFMVIAKLFHNKDESVYVWVCVERYMRYELVVNWKMVFYAAYIYRMQQKVADFCLYVYHATLLDVAIFDFEEKLPRYIMCGQLLHIIFSFLKNAYQRLLYVYILYITLLLTTYCMHPLFSVFYCYGWLKTLP